jgi:hypothetical protein
MPDILFTLWAAFFGYVAGWEFCRIATRMNNKDRSKDKNENAAKNG